MRNVHIVPGDSGAGSLRQALGVSGEQEVVGLRDDLSCGPLPITSSLEQWARVRHDFWQGVQLLREDAAHADLLSEIRLLKEADLITLWLGNGLSDQITLPWLCWLLRLSGIDESRLRVVQFPGGFVACHATPSLGFLTPRQILKHPPAAALSIDDLVTMESAWQALTGSTPTQLRDFVGAHPDGPLSRALASLADRFPQRDTGLSHWDRQLIVNTVRFGPKAALIVGNTLSVARWGTDPVGDIWLLWRLRRVGDPSLPHPLIMRGLSVSITDAGQQVLSGAANAVELNGIDDWIGNVHLNSAANRVWFASGGYVIC